jgi:hypothetical protein
MGVIEVREKDTDDGCRYIIYWYIDRIDKGKKEIRRIQVWSDKETWYYVQSGKTGKIQLDESAEVNPRPHVVYTDQKTGQRMGYSLGYIPFWRLDNNKKQFSGLKPVKALIDDYDLMQCGLSNNVVDFDRPLHVVSGFQGDNLDELQTNLKTKKIIGVDEGGSYSYTKNSLSDRYAKFWLETQKALSKINPKVTVMGYAYLNTVLPPRHVKLHSKIMVGYVGTPFFPLTREKMAQTRKEWDGWAKTGCVMQFRPNTTWSGGVYPLQYWRPLAAEYRRILQKPETKMAHFDTFRGEYANMGPMWYVLARLTARPDLTVEEVADEYFGSFGKAGPVIREYFDFWEKLSDSVTEEDVKKIRKELGWGINVWNNWDICVKLFTPAHFAQGAKILKKAEQIAATKWEKENVRFFQLGLEHARLAEITAEAHFKRAHNNTPANQADFDKKYKTLLEFRKRHERSWISNMGHLTAKEAGGFRRSVLKK